jgi:hypothetical protein
METLNINFSIAPGSLIPQQYKIGDTLLNDYDNYGNETYLKNRGFSVYGYQLHWEIVDVSGINIAPYCQVAIQKNNLHLPAQQNLFTKTATVPFVDDITMAFDQNSASSEESVNSNLISGRVIFPVGIDRIFRIGPEDIFHGSCLLQNLDPDNNLETVININLLMTGRFPQKGEISL